MNNQILIAHIESENPTVGGCAANAEGMTYSVFPSLNGKMEDIKKGQFLRCLIHYDGSSEEYYLEVLEANAIATEQEWREQEMEHDNPLAKHYTVDINPETLHEWVEKNEDPDDIYAKNIDDYYEDITKEVMQHFNFGFFKTTEDLPYDYVTYEGHYPIERVWKFENDDVKIFDFENNINKHRLQMVFIAKTLKGLDLIDKYLEKIHNREWLMCIDSEEFIFLEISRSTQVI